MINMTILKLASCKSTLNPPMVYSTDRSKAVVPVLVLLFVALWFLNIGSDTVILFAKGAELTILGQLKIPMKFSVNLNLKTLRLLNCLHMIFLHCILCYQIIFIPQAGMKYAKGVYSFCLFCLSVCLSICLSVCLSVCELTFILCQRFLKNYYPLNREILYT